MSLTNLSDLLDALWADYRRLNPQADAIHALLADAGAAIGTDGRSDKPMRTYVVIAEPDGQVVTMYPGR